MLTKEHAYSTLLLGDFNGSFKSVFILLYLQKKMHYDMQKGTLKINDLDLHAHPYSLVSAIVVHHVWALGRFLLD